MASSTGIFHLVFAPKSSIEALQIDHNSEKSYIRLQPLLRQLPSGWHRSQKTARRFKLSYKNIIFFLSVSYNSGSKITTQYLLYNIKDNPLTNLRESHLIKRLTYCQSKNKSSKSITKAKSEAIPSRYYRITNWWVISRSGSTHCTRLPIRMGNSNSGLNMLHFSYFISILLTDIVNWRNSTSTVCQFTVKKVESLLWVSISIALEMQLLNSTRFHLGKKEFSTNLNKV